MEIKNTIEKEIDNIDDGINFKMTLFSEGKYVRHELRNVVRNVGVKLEIENQLFEPLEIGDLYFAIFLNNKMISRYQSTTVKKFLPAYMYAGETITLFFQGHDLKMKFERSQNESGMFALTLNGNKLISKSSKFNGDKMEQEITKLEEGEEANWTSPKYHIFDLETIYKI